jgi:hypothetical protein
MNSPRQFGWVLAALLFVLVPTASLLAQDQNTQDQNSGGSPSNDPPARVARLQYISGEVSLQPGGVNDWVAANLNRPLTTSDRVWTDKDSRAELNVGTGFLRMNSESSLTLTNVSDNTIQAELDQGVLELTVRHLEPGEIYEIDTPNLAFTVMKSGVYRFDVNPNDDQTWVTVRKGYGEATGRGSAVKVSDDQQVRFTGQNSLQHEAYSAPAPDGFDDWAKVRDKRLDSSVSARYVAPGVIGYEDLDTYGRWQVVATYGNVWFPAGVAVGWAPYRYGHWAWIAPWGWTWVDDAPWGFAPFHYGRWVYWGGAWGWAPGPIYGVGWRPYYAPALVGWIGGAGWGVSIGFGFGGGCGWFPLGWGEPFYPWYHGYRGGYVSRNYIRNVNVTNTHITNVNNVTNNYYNNTINNTHFVNRNIAGAVTAAPKSALASGQNMARVGTVVPRAEIGKGEVVRNIDVAPTRQAVLGGNTPRNTGIPPRSAVNRPVVSRETPPARVTNPVTEAHTVPQAPVTLGARNPSTAPQAVQTHSVPRPPTTNTGGTYGAPATPAHTNAPNTTVREGEAVSPAHTVPRPPERTAGAGSTITSGNASQAGSSRPEQQPTYGSGRSAQQSSNTGSNQPVHVATPPHETTQVARPSSPPAQGNHASQPKESKPKEQPRPNPGTASVQVPSPPAGYRYHAAPAYTASSSYSGSGASYAASRSYSAPAAAYGSGNRSYTAPAPPYRDGGSPSPAPSYNARVTAPGAQHYSPPPVTHYSAPPSGGGAASHASSGHSGGRSR